MMYPGVSVIVTTYNWPKALARVLESLCVQQYSNMEVIIADDGSTQDTADFIHRFQQHAPFPIIHCWQEDDGFRAAQIRNRAVAMANHDYLIFLDGDCVVLPNFVARHAQLAEPGWFVAGNRILLNQAFTQQVLEQEIPIHHFSALQWFSAMLTRKSNRFAPVLALPLGPLRKWSPLRWQGVKTCNLGMWRQDILDVNGLDENFVGWGFEDSDLVIRLQRNKVYRKQGKFATPVFHLWHPTQERSQLKNNANLLEKTQTSTHTWALKGIEQYIHEHRDQKAELE